MRQLPLKGYGTFGRVFNQGKRFRATGLTAFVTFRPPDCVESHNEMHVGVTCRRGTKPAVMRNRIKRLLREAVRREIAPKAESLAIAEVILIWQHIPQRPQQLHLSRVCDSLKQLLHSIEKQHG